MDELPSALCVPMELPVGPQEALPDIPSPRIVENVNFIIFSATYLTQSAQDSSLGLSLVNMAHLGHLPGV